MADDTGKERSREVLEQGTTGFVATITPEGKFEAKTFTEVDEYDSAESAAFRGVQFADALREHVIDFTDRVATVLEDP